MCFTKKKVQSVLFMYYYYDIRIYEHRNFYDYVVRQFYLSPLNGVVGDICTHLGNNLDYFLIKPNILSPKETKIRSGCMSIILVFCCHLK